MEVECLALKDLTSPRNSFMVQLEEEDGGEHKENICRERRRSTPMKSEAAAMLANRRGAAPDADHATPVKHQPLPEPWTPTANLKMLISVASPDIREREMKKVLFALADNDADKDKSADAAAEGAEAEEEEEDDAEKKPSRKQKSLGLLCQKFLALYPDYPPPHNPIWIPLDEVAASLGVERRRIYDIVNVLESLTIVGRIAKNCYTWYGRQRLEATLEELQQRGRKQGYHLHMEPGVEAPQGGLGREDEGAEGDHANVSFFSFGFVAASNRKDKSLRIMSQKFVMLFLVSKTQTVTLDTAAKVLIEDGQDSSSHSKYKTKVRRLYDIANVLTSLNLIKKVHVREERSRKPAFKWLGSVDFNRSAAAASAPQRTCWCRLSAASAPSWRPRLPRHVAWPICRLCPGLLWSCCTGRIRRPKDRGHPKEAEGAECSSEGPGELPQTSHYLLIPNNAGLNGVNFLIPAGQPPASIALSPTLAVPYVLVPSTALSHYPLVAGRLPPQVSDAQASHPSLSFSLPNVMPHPHYMVGAAPYGLAAGSERSPLPPATPERSRLQGTLTGTPNSPSGLHQTVSVSTPEPLTPNEAGSQAFFRTPGILGSAAVAVPGARKRGSAQRRLDVGPPPNS
ncbi:unnamed protein product [Tetraodon nigroviridis]|uniref:Transcription factor E2F7 n=1 Tax=Tetraodon nigroviridis TaxID=99883 RepID=Q4T105_TETNG|nr:unnamed protein product [Tetraodon nigroviridis]